MAKIKSERKAKTDIYNIVILHTASEEFTEKFIRARLKDIKGVPLPNGVKSIECRYHYMKSAASTAGAVPSYLFFAVSNTIYNVPKLVTTIKDFVIKDLDVENLPEGITKIREEWLWGDSKMVRSLNRIDKSEPSDVPIADAMPEPQYSCEYCSKSCSSASGLTLHQKRCSKK